MSRSGKTTTKTRKGHVIPTKVGMTKTQPGRLCYVVWLPAFAGTTKTQPGRLCYVIWFPAFAGMTKTQPGRLCYVVWLPALVCSAFVWKNRYKKQEVFQMARVKGQ